jgi:3-methyladenine DNA glycosylase AlkC
MFRIALKINVFCRALFVQTHLFSASINANEFLAMASSSRTCVLLFSGGRDSTLAAIRLGKSFDHVVLVTILSPHMTGLSKVQSRVEELKRILAVRCEWMLVPETRLVPLRTTSDDIGCIDCHFGYFVTAHSIARQLECESIACGFVQYQNAWVEQTPYAVRRLSELMAEHGTKLVFPVAELGSKEEVEAELKSNLVSTDSLELKCSRQQPDPGLTGGPLQVVVDRGMEALRAALERKQTAEPPLQRIDVSGRNL